VLIVRAKSDMADSYPPAIRNHSGADDLEMTARRTGQVIHPGSMMFVLRYQCDFRVMRPEPHQAVVRLGSSAATSHRSTHKTSPRRNPVRAIGLIKEGRRGSRSTKAMPRRRCLMRNLSGRRRLPSTTEADRRYADIIVSRRQRGEPIHAFDALMRQPPWSPVTPW